MTPEAIEKTSASAAELAVREIEILGALWAHPLLSPRQLMLYSNRPLREIRTALRLARQRGWIHRYNAQQPWLRARSLYWVSLAGIAALTERRGVSKRSVGRRKTPDPARLGLLVDLMERVFQVRTFLLWLRRNKPGWDWVPIEWDVEVAEGFQSRLKRFQLAFHGAAQMQRRDGRWCRIVVEWDLRRVPVEKDRPRLAKLVAAQEDPRFWGDGDAEFPIWVLIAQDEFRLQDYYALLRALASARQLPMPRAYLATFAEVLELRDVPLRPIWYSTVSGQRVPLLQDTPGCDGPRPIRVPWHPLRLGPATQDSTELHADVSAASIFASAPRTLHIGSENTAAFGPSLASAERLVLDEIGAHPLLAAQEMASLLHLSAWRTELALSRLEELGLAIGRTLGKHAATPSENGRRENPSNGRAPLTEKRYLLTERGVRHHARIAGFGRAVKRYARARGWADGFETLVRFWEHTREENSFFVSLARLAQTRGDELVWLSELESRLYYDHGSTWVGRAKRREALHHPRNRLVAAARGCKAWHPRRSFLPDGRGTYIAGGRYEFALEIDRSYHSRAKLRRKLVEYHACITANILHSRGIELLRLLVVTLNWARAETLRTIALELEQELEVTGRLLIFITTFDDLRTRGVDAPIWARVALRGTAASTATDSRTYCFDCFTAVPRSTRRRRRARSTRAPQGGEK